MKPKPGESVRVGEGTRVRGHKLQILSGKRRGIYETTYGNAAYVSGPKAKIAYDLDMGERVPMSEVTDKFLREAEPTDYVRSDW